ncbi:MAG: hypothetical protein EON49_12925 [Acidovorax sp.]|nr:MAG: hypothetical protein EON49_12925 [Acidovorax sp.]
MSKPEDSMTSRTAAWVTGAVLVCLALPAAALLAAWMLFDVSDARPGWPAYYLGVPASIRSATGTLEECRPARFRWKGRDGLGVPFVVMVYGSRLEPEQALARHAASLRPLACRLDTDRAAVSGAPNVLPLRCEHPDVAEADIQVEGAGPCREVSVGFVLND